MERSQGYLVAITVLLVVVVLVLASLLAVDFFNRDNASDMTGTQNNGVVEVARDTDRLSRIVNNPEDYYGTQTIVEGEIQDVYNDRVFSLSDQAIGDELLIVTQAPLSDREADEGKALFEDNADAQVVGQVRELITADVERDFDINLEPEIEADFESRPVMIGELVQYRDEDSLFDFNQGIEEDL